MKPETERIFTEARRKRIYIYVLRAVGPMNCWLLWPEVECISTFQVMVGYMAKKCKSLLG
jgi:hypothetical protein